MIKLFKVSTKNDTFPEQSGETETQTTDVLVRHQTKYVDQFSYKEGALRSFPLTSPFNFDIETYTDGNSFEWGICSGNKEEARVKFTSE